MSRHDPVCDLDLFLKVSPLAVVALVGVSMDLLGLSVSLPSRIAESVVWYVAGLIVVPRATARSVAGYLGETTHDRLTRMLAKDSWRTRALMMGMLRLVGQLGVRGVLILDDTLLPHDRSKKMAGVYRDWDHAEQRFVYGQRLVLLLWTNGLWRIPIAYAFWHKKGVRPRYKTKNDIARTLLRWAVSRGLRPDYVTFDNWYASKQNLKFIVSTLRLEFVTKLKKNTYLSWEGKKLQAKTIGQRLLGASRPYRTGPKGTWARGTVVQLSGMGPMSFVVAKDVTDGAERPILRYLLASTPRRSAREVVRRYKQRWTIEVFFRDLKQHLSIKDHQGRSLVAAEHHVACACIGAVVLDHVRVGTDMTPGETKQLLQRLVFLQTPTERFRLALLQATPGGTFHEELEEAKKAVRRQLPRLTGQRLRRPTSPTAAV